MIKFLQKNLPRLIAKMLVLSLMFGISRIGFTNSYFTSQATIAGNQVSTGTWEDPQRVAVSSVIINEVMWMGSTDSSADEWIELSNTTDEDIDISNWRITNAVSGEGHLEIPANHIIPANGYFLISNYYSNHSNSAINNDITVDLRSTNLSLNNDYEDNGSLILKDKDGNIIDSTPDPTSGVWPAGFLDGAEGPHKSMERNDDPSTGWHTCIDSGCNSTTYWDNSGDNYGTPKGVNLSRNDSSAQSVSLNLSRNKKSVSFKVSNVKNFIKLSYQLTYETDTIPDGVNGEVLLHGQNTFNENNITLGTCSSGGICTYYTGVKNIRLEVILEDADGKTTTISTSL